MGWEGCTKDSGMAVDGLKSTSDVALMLCFKEEGEEKEGEEESLRLEGKEFEGGDWGCPTINACLGSVKSGSATFLCFKRASRRAFNFSAL